MKTSAVVPFVTLLVGAGLGYFVGKDQVVEKVDHPSMVSSRSSSGGRPAANSSSSSPVLSFEGFAERILVADSDGVKEILASIRPEERCAHIDFLLEQSGPGGLDYQLKSAIKKILGDLLKEDRDGTVRWIMEGEHIGNRDHLFEEALDDKETEKWVLENFDSLLARGQLIEQPHEFLKELIATQVDSDPVKAIQLSKKHLVNYEGELDFPPGLQEKAVAHGWETAFEYYKDSWKEGNDSSSASWGGSFPKDFDFSSFAEAWKKHEGARELSGNNGGFYEPPVYLWKAWSEHQPEAAFDFLANGGSVTFEFDDFFDGYSEGASAEEVFEFSSNVLANPPEIELDVDRELFSYLADDVRNLNSYVEWSRQNDAGPLVQTLVKGINVYGDNEKDTGVSILNTIPEDQRLGQIRESFTEDGNFRMWGSRRKWFGEALQALGHSESEINAAFGEK
jgi:hypothetical protein